MMWMRPNPSPEHRPRLGRSRGACRGLALLLLIGAVLFAGMWSRVAHRIATESAQELIRSESDPVKYPPPEEKVAEDGSSATAAVAGAIPTPPVLRLLDPQSSVLYAGQNLPTGHPLRAPPVSA